MEQYGHNSTVPGNPMGQRVRTLLNPTKTVTVVVANY